MLKISRHLYAIAFSLFRFSTAALAQEQETFKKKGYTLTFTNQDRNFDPALKNAWSILF